MSDAAAAAASSVAVPPAPASSRGGAVSTRAPGGQGTMRWPNGDSWEGASKDGQRQGVGWYRWSDGRIYAGEFEANQHSGLGVLYDKDGQLIQRGRWKDDKFVESCAVPLRCIPEGRRLSDAALQIRRAHPGGSLVLFGDSFYLGEVNAQGQPDQLGASFHLDGSPKITLQVDEDASLSGRWINGKLHGRATQVLPSGDRYEGLFKDGLREGLGAYIWKDGRRYEGEWVAGKCGGLGAWWNEEGKLTACGRWKNDKLVEWCAVPLRLLPEGKYLSVAALQAKLAHPKASALLPSGAHYVGPLNAQGQPKGQGASFHPDGKPEITLLVDEHEGLSGQWVDGLVNGRATHVVTDGDRYEGLFKDGDYEGLGAYSWPDGSRYEGEFVADESSGLGVKWNTQGKLDKCGRWETDKLVKSCAVPLQCLPQKRFLSPHAKTASLLFPDGGYYVGPINARNQRDGEGSMYTSGGALIVSGRWLNDRPVQPAPLPAALASSAAFASSFAAAVAAAAASPSSSALPAVAAAAAAAPTAAASSLSSVAHTPVAAAASAAASAAALASSSSTSATPVAASSASAPAISAAAFPVLGFPLSSPLPSSASSLSLPGITGLYEGERNDAGQRHGLGVQWGADGVIARCGRWAEDKYVGKSAVPLKHLQGALLSVSALRAKLDHPDGSLVRLDLRRFYVGQVNYRHVPHGQGSSFYRDGFPEIVLAVDDADPSLSGRWVKGMLHGRATQMLSNGICYSGLFKDSGFEGLGVYVWPTGERFEGEFAAGKFNGFGAQWDSRGTLSKCGRWEDDVCVEECAVALDRILEGAAQCRLTYPNGSLVRLDETGRFYIGAVNERGQPHGQGQTFYPSGAPQYTPTVDPTARLSGRWVDGLLQGRATRMLVRGARYDGLFHDDQYEGLGVYVGSAGWRYEGEWEAGNRSGLGALWDSQGKLIKCGRWEESKLVASCAVPIHVLPDKHWLSPHAKAASLLFPDGGYFVGPVNAQNQRDGGSSLIYSASGDLLYSGTWSNEPTKPHAHSPNEPVTPFHSHRLRAPLSSTPPFPIVPPLLSGMRGVHDRNGSGQLAPASSRHPSAVMRSHNKGGGDSPRIAGPPVTPLAASDRSDSNGSAGSSSSSAAPSSPVMSSADCVLPPFAAYYGQKDEQGRAHGYGAVLTPDGEIVQQRCGKWTAGELTAQGIIFITHLPPDAPLSPHASLMYGLHPNGDYFVPFDARQTAQDKPPAWGTRYHKDGSLNRGGHFIPPKLHGLCYRYDPGVGSLSGQFEHGVASGQGKYFFLTGARYEGGWARDKQNGLGRMTLPTGETYEGEWSNGQRHGLGVTRDAKGALLHVGRYAKDVQGAQCPVPRSLLPFGGFTDAISDQCDLLYPMGDFFCGQINANNLPHGGGTLFHSSGAPLMGGEWVEGELHGHGFVFPSSGGRYVGGWAHGQWNGLGMHVGARGERYDGHWLGNRMHGLGRRVYEDGETYEGEWAAGARGGLGMVWDKTGTLIECGRFGSDGQGGTKLELSCPVPRSMLLYGNHLSAPARTASLLYPNGSYYTGRLNSSNESHGAGCLYTESGEIIAEGIWDSGKLVDSTNKRARAESACGTTCLAMTLANEGRGTIMRGRHALLLGVPDVPAPVPSSMALSALPPLSVSLPSADSVRWGLSLLSFQCSVHSAPSSTQMTSALSSFLSQIQPGDLVFVLFNGYASAGPNGSTYLIPSDWRSGDTLERSAVSLDAMLAALQSSQCTNVILLDIEPAPASYLSAAQPQLKPVRQVQLPEEGAFFIAISQSTKPAATVVPVSSAGAVATAASSSNALTPPFVPGTELSTLLLPHLRTPGVHLTDAVMRANKAMLQLTNGQRRIISTSSLADDIVLYAEKAMSTVRYY